MNNTLENLICPISTELLVEPITTPCCGKLISRDSLRQSLEHNTDCPLCRVPITVSIDSIPTCRNINYMLDGIERNDDIEELIQNRKKWIGTITPIKTNLIKNKIAHLKIKNDSYVNKKLIISALDTSGSMSGNPSKQVMYSTERIINMAFGSDTIDLEIITYSDTASSTKINNHVSCETNMENINKSLRVGGTNFKSAFDEIIKVVSKYSDIKNIVILFMTDGMDASRMDKISLVNHLKTGIKEVYKHNFIVHTIAFGSSHDADLLNNMRITGTSEGVYRYADPSENIDILSSKINSIIDVILTSSDIPIDVTMFNQKIIHGTNDEFWINFDASIDSEMTINIDNIEHKIEFKINNVDEDNKLKNKWYSYLTDNITNELLLCDKDTSELKYELLLKRCRIISINSSEPRISAIIENIQKLVDGGSVNKMKLQDLKTEGTFKTKISQKIDTLNASKSSMEYYTNTIAPKKVDISLGHKRHSGKPGSPEIFIDLANSQTLLVIGKINNRTIDIYAKDENGSNALIVASSIGRVQIVELLLDSNEYDIDYKNNYDFTALDYALFFGKFRTAKMLLDKGGELSQSATRIFEKCIAYKFHNTITLMIKEHLLVIKESMIKNCPNHSVDFLLSKLGGNISIEDAIEKGLYDKVEELLDTTKHVSFNTLRQVFAKSTKYQCDIVDLLLLNNKMDVNETFNIKIDEIDEVTFPMFIVCEKGNEQMFDVLIKYFDKNNINIQNNRGVSLLWIAICNNHLNIALKLLNLNINVDLQNSRGETALIPACQKGSELAVDILLNSKTDIFLHHPERDNCFIVCCRSGQPVIFEKLLNLLDNKKRDEILNTCAFIDGFNPLLSAVEQQKTECIGLCVTHGTDVNFKTSLDNPIIANATGAHLACMYNLPKSLHALSELGCDMNSQMYEGLTPLHISIKKNNYECIDYLINICNVDVNIKDDYGKSAIYYATSNERLMKLYFTNNLEVILKKLVFGQKNEEIINNIVEYLKETEDTSILKTKFNGGISLLTFVILLKNQALIDFIVNNYDEFGLNLNEIDETGLCPAFWLSYYGRIKITDISSVTNRMIQNIKYFENKSIENKFLIDISMGMPKNTELITSGELNSKMNKTYNFQMLPSVMNDLMNHKTQKYSLLDFMNKIKKKSSSTIEPQLMEQALWNAKYHIIKSIATSSEQSIDPVYIFAIYMYTSSNKIVEQVNMELNNWNNSVIWKPFVHCLYQGLFALSSIDPEIEIFKSIEYCFTDEFAIGKELSWNSFNICSKDWTKCSELINKKTGIIFIIHSKTAKDISNYSHNVLDNEIIVLPNTKFTVVNHYLAHLHTLGQPNIRKSTFKVKDDDYERIVGGKGCIIIEIEENN
jgi:ankyrin repeat protein